MQTSTKCYILVVVVVVAGCVYGGLYGHACVHPLSGLAEKMLSPERRARQLVLHVPPNKVFMTLDVLQDMDMGASAVPGLVECLSDQDPLVRRVAVGALGETGAPSAIPALEALLSGDEDQTVRSGARWAIANIHAAEAD